MPNAFKDIITRLERQRASIDRALTALREVDDNDPVNASESFATKTKRKGKRRRMLSEEARARMAAGQQRRWAAKRAAEKTAAKKSPLKVSLKKATAKES